MILIARTLYGLEEVLAGELREIGAEEIRTANRAVIFKGNKRLLYRANYLSRTALAVLMQISEFSIKTKDDLYRNCMGIDWDRFLKQDQTFAVSSVVNSRIFSHSGYPALVVKDAVADWFRKKSGKRPSVDTSDPHVIINLHISGSLVNISLDSSGAPLYKRGYRRASTQAPLNEVLAAGIIKLSGWDPSSDFLDPMCGSGTLPVEAALMACSIPPGKFRDSFGFMKWPGYDPGLFEEILKESEKKVSLPKMNISGSDISGEAVKKAQINVRTAGLEEVVRIRKADFRELKAEGDSGFIVMNPPYGERLKPEALNELYSMIGSALKHNFPGYKAWIISSDKEAMKQIGLKPAKKFKVYNGPLECVLAGYNMYQGSRRKEEVKSKK
ncbi:MAG: class I SAM-dependent RNA methyltransferase [Bacteroidales bacterium]|nr:class I SAM-dependent RNA methyltransferase [Bacteroidales bacterium]